MQRQSLFSLFLFSQSLRRLLFRGRRAARWWVGNGWKLQTYSGMPCADFYKSISFTLATREAKLTRYDSLSTQYWYSPSGKSKTSNQMVVRRLYQRRESEIQTRFMDKSASEMSEHNPPRVFWNSEHNPPRVFFQKIEDTYVRFSRNQKPFVANAAGAPD